MSIITLQYGQCGNQISQVLYSNIHSNLDAVWDLEHCLKWFDINAHNQWEPRSVLIDTEGKTTNNFPKSAPYKFKNIVAKSYGGSANNWAFAYTNRSRLLMGEIVEAVRSEVEKCDLLTSFLNVFSSSGGTGSGIGSAVLEYLREEYPNKTLINSVILPYLSGEIVIQSYNTILTLAKVHGISDGSMIFENDRLHYTCSNNLDVKNVSFGDINNLIAEQLCSVYQPVKNLYLPHMLAGLCTQPAYKLLNVRSAPLGNADKSCNWKYVYSSVQRQSRFDYQQQAVSGSKLKPKNLVSALISRGVHVPSNQDLREYKDSNLYVTWLPDYERAQTYHDVRQFQKLENHLTLISNNNSICTSLGIILKDAWNLFRYGAYLHHYEQFGVDKDYFIDSFEKFQKLIHHVGEGTILPVANLMVLVFDLTVMCSVSKIRGATMVGSTNWNYEDKKKLVMAIKLCGTDNLEALQNHLPHRSVTEIRYLWEKYSKMAMAKRKKEEKEKEDPTPINEWINVLKKMKTTQVVDILPRALKYIALYEERPEDKDVDLSECYMTLSQMTNGHVGKTLNPKTSVFFYQNLTKLANKLKHKDLSKEKDFVGTIKKLRVYRKGPVRRTYSNKKQEKKLASNTILNPLSVPDELLKNESDTVLGI